MNPDSERLVGLIPAAGRGSRISPLPGSKEVFPVGFNDRLVDGETKRCPKVISQYVIERMAAAGVRNIYMVISEGKWDIPRYYGNGQRFGVNLGYLVVEELLGMPYSLDTAFPWLQGATVVFGMPDTIFSPEDAFSRLLSQHRHMQADLTLGLFPTDQPWRLSMVEHDAEMRVLSVTDKPATSKLKCTWGCGVWGERFTGLMHSHMPVGAGAGEIILADFFNMAVKEKLDVRAVEFEHGEFIDVGSPADLEWAVRHFNPSAG